MDVLESIDRLHDLVHNAKHVPLRGEVRVDKEKLDDLLNQLRVTIPEELKEARWIVKEREEMLAAAKLEAERILCEARERQTQLVVEHHLTGQAELASEEIIDGAPRRGARDSPWRRGLCRRDPQHLRDQPLQVHRRHPARPRTPPAPGRTGRARVVRAAQGQAARACREAEHLPALRSTGLIPSEGSSR